MQWLIVQLNNLCFEIQDSNGSAAEDAGLLGYDTA
jgi:hypothetical protein